MAFYTQGPFPQIPISHALTKKKKKKYKIEDIYSYVRERSKKMKIRRKLLQQIFLCFLFFLLSLTISQQQIMESNKRAKIHQQVFQIGSADIVFGFVRRVQP